MTNASSNSRVRMKFRNARGRNGAIVSLTALFFHKMLSSGRRSDRACSTSRAPFLPKLECCEYSIMYE